VLRVTHIGALSLQYVYRNETPLGLFSNNSSHHISENVILRFSILMKERYSGLEVLRTRDKDVFFMHYGTVVSQKTHSSRVYFLYVNICILPSKHNLLYQRIDEMSVTSGH